MTARWLLALICAGACAVPAVAADGDHAHHDGHQMTLDASGMVMNENTSQLPNGCEAIGAEHTFEVRAGTEFAASFPGHTFGMSAHEWRVEPCSRIKVTFINEDDVRHQWMVHGLPRYLYPGGMFHLEAAGRARQTGTFIVPPEARTYLVHCDLAQHMEKGMKGQLVVGGGDGDLWSVPGVSDAFTRDAYLPRGSGWLVGSAFVTAVALGTFVLRRRW